MRASSLFLSHGAPTIALERGAYPDALGRFGRDLPAPSALVVFSGHFQDRSGIRITASPHPPTIHDFSGFPDALYALTYPAPGSPDLAERIRTLLEADGRTASLDPVRGWDHGLWMPLRFVFPDALIPIVEVSLPEDADPEELMRIGSTLAPLRERGVLLVGSGGIVHNLRRVRFGGDPTEVEPWAKEFDDWVAQRLENREIARLADYRRQAPHADLAVPTSEHFDPLFVALGYAKPEDEAIPIYTGFQYGTVSLRSFAMGRN